jgi:hypothetical protein
VKLALDTGNTNFSGGTNNSVDLESKPLMKRGEDGEFEDTRGKNNK